MGTEGFSKDNFVSAFCGFDKDIALQTHQVQHLASGIACSNAHRPELPCPELEIRRLREDMDELKRYVDTQMESVEMHIQADWKCRWMNQTSLNPQMPMPCELEDPTVVLRDLQTRMQRLEMLLFCVPIPDFQKIDESIQAIMNGDCALPRTPVVTQSDKAFSIEAEEVTYSAIGSFPDDASMQLLVKSANIDNCGAESLKSVATQKTIGPESRCDSASVGDIVLPAEVSGLQQELRSIRSGLDAQWKAAGTENDAAFESMMSDMANAEECLQMLSVITQGLDAHEMD
jgi:hypothetical protein